MAERKIELTIVLDDKGSVKRTTKNIKTLNKAVEKVQGTGNRASKAVNETKRNLEGVSQRANNAGKDFSRMAQGMGGLVQAYATVAANVFALSSAFRVLQLSADLSSALISARDLTAITGRNFKDLASSIQAATGQALNFEQSVTAANRAAATGASNKQINQLATLAAKAAQTFGGTTTDALNRFTDAVLRGRTELVSKIGIVIDAERATENYAASLGKSAQDLTEFEKKQALTNAILEQGQKILGDVTLDPNPYEQVTRAFQDLGFQALEAIRTIGGFDKLAKLLVEMRELVVLFAAVIVKAIAGRALPAVGLLGEALVRASKKSSAAAAASAKAAKVSANAIATERSKLTNLNRAELEKELNAFTRMQERKKISHKSFTKAILDQEKKLNIGVLVERRNALARELKLRAQGGKSLAAFQGDPTQLIERQLKATNAIIARETTTQTRLVSEANEKIATSTSKLGTRIVATTKSWTTQATAQIRGFTSNAVTSFATISQATASGTGFLGLSAGVERLSKRFAAATRATKGSTAAMSLFVRGTTLASGAVGILTGALSRLVGILTGPIGLILLLFGPTLWEKAKILIGKTTEELSKLSKGLEDNANILEKNDTTFENYAKRLKDLDITKIEDLTTKFEFQANALDDLLGQIRDLDQIIKDVSPLGLNIEGSAARLNDLQKALNTLKQTQAGTLLNEEGDVRSRFSRTFLGRGGETGQAVRQEGEKLENQINAIREQLPTIAAQYGSALVEAARLGGIRGIKLINDAFEGSSSEIKSKFSNIITAGVQSGLSNKKIVEQLNKSLESLPNNLRDQLATALQGLNRKELENIISDSRVLAGATQSVQDFGDEYDKLINDIEKKNISNKSLFSAFSTLGGSLDTQLDQFQKALGRGDASKEAAALARTLGEVPKALLEASKVTQKLIDDDIFTAASKVESKIEEILNNLKSSALIIGEKKALQESSKIQEQINTTLLERVGSISEARKIASDISDEQATQLRLAVEIQSEKVRQRVNEQSLLDLSDKQKAQALETLEAEKKKLKQLENQKASYDKIFEANGRVLKIQTNLLNIQKETSSLESDRLGRLAEGGQFLDQVFATRNRELEIEQNLIDLNVKRLNLEHEINRVGASTEIGQALQKQLKILDQIVELEKTRVGISERLQAQLIASDASAKGIKLQTDYIKAAVENARDFLAISRIQVAEQANQVALRQQEIRQTELNIQKIKEERDNKLKGLKRAGKLSDQITRESDVQIAQEQLKAKIAAERLTAAQRELKLQQTIADSREAFETTAFGGIFTEEGFERFGIILGDTASERLLKGIRSTQEVFADNFISGAEDMADSFSKTLAESGSFSNAFKAAGESIKEAIRNAFAENLANRIKQIIGSAIVGPEEAPIEDRISKANEVMVTLTTSLDNLKDSVNTLVTTIGGQAPEDTSSAIKESIPESKSPIVNVVVDSVAESADNTDRVPEPISPDRTINSIDSVERKLNELDLTNSLLNKLVNTLNFINEKTTRLITLAEDPTIINSINSVNQSLTKLGITNELLNTINQSLSKLDLTNEQLSKIITRINFVDEKLVQLIACNCNQETTSSIASVDKNVLKLIQISKDNDINIVPQKDTEASDKGANEKLNSLIQLNKQDNSGNVISSKLNGLDKLDLTNESLNKIFSNTTFINDKLNTIVTLNKENLSPNDLVSINKKLSEIKASENTDPTSIDVEPLGEKLDKLNKPTDKTEEKMIASNINSVDRKLNDLVQTNQEGFDGLDSTLVGFLTKLVASGASKTGDILSGLFKAGVSIFSGGAGAGAAGGSATPKMATGGIATQPSIISEYGQPEAAVPLPNGKEIPVKMEGGSSNVNINQSFDFRNADPSSAARLRTEARRIEQATFNRVFSEINKGGKYAKMTGRRR